jgi:CRISPR/Cas system CSM-associated protein Csm3 (group 7 of RAMP superfamily)
VADLRPYGHDAKRMLYPVMITGRNSSSKFPLHDYVRAGLFRQEVGPKARNFDFARHFEDIVKDAPEGLSESAKGKLAMMHFDGIEFGAVRADSKTCYRKFVEAVEAANRPAARRGPFLRARGIVPRFAQETRRTRSQQDRSGRDRSPASRTGGGTVLPASQGAGRLVGLRRPFRAPPFRDAGGGGMSRHFEAMISVTLQSPFIMAGEEPSQYGVDVAQLRDRNRRPLIPAAQIRGVARHGWRYLEEEDVTLPKGSKTVFGSEGGRVACDPGKVVFSDLVARSNGKNSAITRVAIDDQFGAGKDGSLMTVELAAPIGQEVTFDGIVRIDDVTPDEAALIVGGLTQSLGCVIAIGRFKTVGFGEVTAVEVKNLRPIVEPTAIAVAGVTTDMDLTFGLDRPLLVDIDRPDDNSLRGREVIPGSVLKGALARRLAEDGQSPDAALTAKVLSTMVIGHAFPAVNCDSFGAATPLDFARQKTDSTKKHWRVLWSCPIVGGNCRWR